MASSINADNGVSSGSAGLKSSADSSGVLQLQTNGTTALSIDASQNVSFTNQPTYSGGTANGVAYLNGSKVLTTGSALKFDGTALAIGSVTPSTWMLDVKSAGTGVVTNGIRVNRSSVTTQYGVTNYEGGAFNNVCVNTAGTGCNWNIQYSTDGSTTTQPLTLDASGQLGIGVTSMNASLHVQGSATTDGSIAFNSQFASTTAYNSSPASGSMVALKYTSGGSYAGMGGWSIGKENATDGNYSSYFAMHTRANGGAITERARIDSSGRMLLNTTTVGAGGGGSTILSAVSLSGQDAVFIKGQSSSAGNLPLGIWNDSSTGDNALLYFYTNSTISYKGGIDFNRTGGLVRYNTSSDATLKNIIGDSDGVRSLEILKSTKIREYAWKDDPTQKPQIGVIAQELFETYKGAVSVGGDIEKTDAQGNVTTEYKPWAVDKTAFTFHLIAGWQAHEKIIQEMKAIIETQASTITQLQADVAALKGASS